MTASAPSALKVAALASLEVVAMTRAPSILANCNANSDTPPVPCVSTVEPGLTALYSTTAAQAVSAAQGKVAAASADKAPGRRSSAASETTSVCCTAPSPPGPPSAVASLTMSGVPAIQPGKK